MGGTWVFPTEIFNLCHSSRVASDRFTLMRASNAASWSVICAFSHFRNGATRRSISVVDALDAMRFQKFTRDRNDDCRSTWTIASETIETHGTDMVSYVAVVSIRHCPQDFGGEGLGEFLLGGRHHIYDIQPPCQDLHRCR